MRRLRRAHRNDDGSVLVLAVVISLILAASATIALSSTASDLAFSNQTSASSQAALASQSGLASEVADLRSATSLATLPCATNQSRLPGSDASYSVSVAYSANGSPLTCTGSNATLGGGSAPTSAALVATGEVPGGAPTVMREDVAIATTTDPGQALGYAIFTNYDLYFSNSATLYASNGNAPNVYVGQTLTCNNHTTSEGGITTQYPITLANSCAFTGSLASAGAVALQNSASVSGDVTSYGGGISLSNYGHIGGNVTAAGDVPAGSENVTLASGATIGSATNPVTTAATGTITSLGVIYGTQQPGDAALASATMSAPVSFPTIDPAVSAWQTNGWNVITVPQSQCTNYFNSTAFLSDMELNVNTVIYAPQCSVTMKIKTVSLNADLVLQVQQLDLTNANTFQASSGTHDLSILASATAGDSTSTVDVNFSNKTVFNPDVDVFIYTQGEVDYANNAGMTGQVLAYGGFTGENAFILTFNPSAAAEIPGDPNPLPPTVSPTDKYVVSGL